MDFETPYLTKQIIAYIGNKRKLLSLIYKALEASGLDMQKPLRFADLFSGSGVVSRFAKQLGFEVHCNDWEPYAEALSRGFVALNKSEFEALFADTGSAGSAAQGFSALIEHINALPPPAQADCYISRYYAAQSDDVNQADFRSERLFYTRQNALSIDKIRSYIERTFPDRADKRRHILLALLLYEAATHTNTSGVFKAFHKGFGGHGKDALSRILAPIALQEPVLIDGRAPVSIYREDANELARRLEPMDVVYLDPPYNQHQYGSNYHLLNTIALWDKIPAPLELDENGVLINKAAIRRDWVQTRSLYCYKKSAAAAFRDLIDHIRARLILVSYSSDGIIPFEEMKAICLTKGYVSVVTSSYTVYRGGKQSNSRKSADIEFVLAIDTARKALPECSERIDNVVLERKLMVLLKRRYNRTRLTARFCCEASKNGVSLELMIPLKKHTMAFVSVDGITLSLAENVALADFTNPELEAACTALEACVCETKQEELEALIALSKNCALQGELKAALRYIKQLPATLKKLAQKKYRATFYDMLAVLDAEQQAHPALYAPIADAISTIARTAEVRFAS